MITKRRGPVGRAGAWAAYRRARLPTFPFWKGVPSERITVPSTFFEHLGLMGGCLLIAWHDRVLRSHEEERGHA
jgi:hypothetical protein